MSIVMDEVLQSDQGERVRDSPMAMDPVEAKKEIEFQNAKAYMLTNSNTSGLNLYDHLSEVLTKILDERPTNAVDVIEEFSYKEKKTKFISDVDTIQIKDEKSTEVGLAEIQEKLFTGNADGDAEEVLNDQDEDVETPLPNLMELCFLFEQAGIGLGREETIRICLALKSLVDTHPLLRVRFWGKILGVTQNYIVAEVEYREGEEDEEEEEEAEEAETEPTDKDDEDQDIEEDEIPKTDFKTPPTVPKEDNRAGVNKKTYFVCNEPGKTWTKLPVCTPAQIVGSRKIKKFFTGSLESPVISYPPFPGNEANLLRAMIARISAGTQISPLGFFQFDEDEEEEDEIGRDNYIENVNYEPFPTRELIDPSLSNWVHHVLHILPQGRTTWWNPVQKGEDDFDDEDDDEEKDEPDEPEPEVGPPLLTPLSEDAEVDNMPPWTAHLSSRLVSQYAVAIVHSNLWPGAHAFAVERKYENIYIGWGQKYAAANYSPPAPPAVQDEYPSGAEITEVDDPTPADEATVRAAQAEAAEAAEEIEEGEDEDEEDD